MAIIIKPGKDLQERFRELLSKQRQPKDLVEKQFFKRIRAFKQQNTFSELIGLGKPWFEPLIDDLSGYYSSYLRTQKHPNEIRLIMTVIVISYSVIVEKRPKNFDIGKLSEGEEIVLLTCEMVDDEHYEKIKKRVTK